MAGLLLASKVSAGFQSDQEAVLQHACLVAEYMSYMAAAGFSLTPATVTDRRLGALKFLARFPDPRAWLSLPVDEQMRCPPRERNFMHYLFLRRLLPMPPAYILAGRPHLSEMGCRLMEREAYQRYHKMACRLGYTTPGIKRQFQSLLCLMAWAQKPMDTLTLADLDNFISSLKAAYSRLDGRRRRTCKTDGLPHSWSAQIPGLRSVLYYLGIFPSMTSNDYYNKGPSFEKQ